MSRVATGYRWLVVPGCLHHIQRILDVDATQEQAMKGLGPQKLRWRLEDPEGYGSLGRRAGPWKFHGCHGDGVSQVVP